jgi:hypothetical protein
MSFTTSDIVFVSIVIASSLCLSIWCLLQLWKATITFCTPAPSSNRMTLSHIKIWHHFKCSVVLLFGSGIAVCRVVDMFYIYSGFTNELLSLMSLTCWFSWLIIGKYLVYINNC